MDGYTIREWAPFYQLKEVFIKQLHFPELTPKKTRVRRDRSVVLSERDLNILEYILDMKFASIQDVFEKFFKVTLSGEEAKSNEWAVRRLQQLSRAGYLKGTHSFSLRDKFYVATMRAYYAVSRAYPEKEVVKPSMVIDQRTFDHDWLVLRARIMLENKRAASCWISDKRLRSNQELAGGLTLSKVPDGIFINEKGERVAFEFELSKKPHEVYREKIKKYVSMIRNPMGGVRVFEKVIYVCAREYVYERLRKETQVYGDLFEVVRYSDFFGVSPGGGQEGK